MNMTELLTQTDGFPRGHRNMQNIGKNRKTNQKTKQIGLYL